MVCNAGTAHRPGSVPLKNMVVLSKRVTSNWASMTTSTVAGLRARLRTASGARHLRSTPGTVPSISFPTKTTSSVKVTWGKPSDGGRALTGFGLLWWTGSNQPPYSSALVKGDPAAREHTYTGLQANTTYKFRIHACNGPDSCGWWTHPPKEVSTLPTPTPTAAPVGRPDRPHTLSFDEIKATSVRATWSIASNTGGVALTGFGLLRWPTGTAEPPHSEAIVVGDGGATDETMTGLTPATTYLFKMRACNGPNRCSDWTANHTFTTLAGTVTPGRVTNLRHSSSGDNSVTLAWNAPGNSAAAAVTGYHVQHRPLESDWPGDGVDVVQGAGTTTFTVSQLVDGTIYEFQVQACNAAGCGAWTDLLHPDHVIVAGHKVGNASLILASTDLAVGGRLGVGIHDIPKGKVAYAQMYGAIQPAGQCSTTRSTRSVARAPSASTGSGYYDTVNIEGCAPGGIGWLRVVNAAETELYARATITVGVPPGKVSQPTVAARNAGLYVQWTAPSAGSEPISHYDLQYREGTSGDWTLVEDIELTSYTITGLTNGTSYQVQVRAASEAGDGEWSDSASGTPLASAPNVNPPPGPVTTPTPIDGCGSIAPGALAKPRDLDIIPYPQRRALLTWVGSEAATHYRVRITRVDTSTTVNGSVANDPCWRINLDNILGLDSPQGLAHATAFQFDVTAREIDPNDATTILRTKGPSETVTLVDNPIVSINGNSKNTQDGKGQAVVRWSKVTGATHYTIMYRELPGDHSQPGWTVEARPPSPQRGIISMAATSAAVDGSNTNILMHTIGGTTTTVHPLERYKIYAVAVNYEDNSGRYFAAREAYVWPSDLRADDGERVGTFPLTRHLGQKTYSYHLCDETFVPAGTLNVRRDSWVDLIDTALMHWQTATDGLVTVEKVDEPCQNFDTEVRKLEMNIRKYLIFLGLDPDNLPESLNLLNTAQIRLYAKSLMVLLKETGVVRGFNDKSSTQNEIYMFNDVDGPNRLFISAYVFGEIASGIGYDCWVDKDGNFDKSAAMCTQSNEITVQDVHGNHRTEWRSDIVVRRGVYDKSDHLVSWGRKATDDPLLVPASNAKFNTCKSTAGSVSADDEGSAYATMVHEAGHALGIRGGSSSGWVQSGHPQVPDSVMNYDDIAVAENPSMAPEERGDFDPDFRERDCGPHPLDQMAIYALYQTD